MAAARNGGKKPNFLYTRGFLTGKTYTTHSVEKHSHENLQDPLKEFVFSYNKWESIKINSIKMNDYALTNNVCREETAACLPVKQSSLCECSWLFCKYSSEVPVPSVCVYNTVSVQMIRWATTISNLFKINNIMKYPQDWMVVQWLARPPHRCLFVVASILCSLNVRLVI